MLALCHKICFPVKPIARLTIPFSLLSGSSGGLVDRAALLLQFTEHFYEFFLQLDEWILLVQRDGCIDNQAICQDHQVDVTAGQGLPIKIGAAFKRDESTARDFSGENIGSLRKSDRGMPT